MEFDEILRGNGQRVPIKEAEIQKYAKGVAALYKEKIALLPEHVKSSMSIGVVAVDIGTKIASIFLGTFLVKSGYKTVSPVK